MNIQKLKRGNFFMTLYDVEMVKDCKSKVVSTAESFETAKQECLSFIENEVDKTVSYHIVEYNDEHEKKIFVQLQKS
jgi:hypothetical protein